LWYSLTSELSSKMEVGGGSSILRNAGHVKLRGTVIRKGFQSRHNRGPFLFLVVDFADVSTLNFHSRQAEEQKEEEGGGGS